VRDQPEHTWERTREHVSKMGLDNGRTKARIDEVRGGEPTMVTSNGVQTMRQKQEKIISVIHTYVFVYDDI